MTVDGNLCCIGTMNLDIRSLELHKELMAWFYDPTLAEQHDRIFEEDLKHCDEILLENIDALTPLQVFRDSACETRVQPPLGTYATHGDEIDSPAVRKSAPEA